MRELWREVLAGWRTVTVQQIQKYCEDHVVKQKAGMMSTTLEARTDRTVGQLIMASPDARQLDHLIRKKQKRVPSDRHQQRMNALYVDAIAPGKWNRPVRDVSQDTARKFLCDAVNDYAGQYRQRYTLDELVQCKDPELFQALQQWPDRPTLAPPEWPVADLTQGG